MERRGRPPTAVQGRGGVVDNGGVGAHSIFKPRDPWRRDARVRLQKVLIVAALLTFMASLFMPAVRVYLDEDDETGTVGPGMQCLVMSRPYYASNTLLYTGPVWCWVLRRRRGPTLAAMVATAALISLGFVVIAPWMVDVVFPISEEGRAAFQYGFYVWVVSHLLMTTALVLPLWGDGRREEEDELRGELERLERKWTPGARAA